jgi:hypothetical protein
LHTVAIKQLFKSAKAGIYKRDLKITRVVQKNPMGKPPRFGKLWRFLNAKLVQESGNPHTTLSTTSFRNKRIDCAKKFDFWAKSDFLVVREFMLSCTSYLKNYRTSGGWVECN